ncbi:hypothetical protein CRUP_033141 [Coryphaenoides rupestris]|nr:hypothetical protein CRUP_033141 [Coryphaenoides rupestris]
MGQQGRWRREAQGEHNATGAGGGAGGGAGAGGGGGKERFVVEQWAPESLCRFVTFVGIASLMVSAVQAWRSFYCLCKGPDPSRLHLLASLLLSSTLLCLVSLAGTACSLGLDACSRLHLLASLLLSSTLLCLVSLAGTACSLGLDAWWVSGAPGGVGWYCSSWSSSGSPPGGGAPGARGNNGASSS